MFAWRHMLKASARLLPMKFLERTAVFPENAPKTLLQTLETDRILRRFSTQVENGLQEQPTKENPLTKHPVGKVEGKMRIMFTCKKCGTRNSKIMTKLAYQKGVVIIRCDGCKNNHLIADNLGWFGSIATKRNIEKIMKDKGDTVKRLNVYGADAFEVVSKDEPIGIRNEERTKVEEEKSAQIDR
ncbi:DNL-type zinc finger protein-like [Diachasmimorpha longicaudata]|uniref:DNL-type zinc finger protein-like n=1 Tax=Diachasmimorpha longicaudata TaxID=58733 RepID=UPI0030B8FD10